MDEPFENCAPKNLDFKNEETRNSRESEFFGASKGRQQSCEEEIATGSREILESPNCQVESLHTGNGPHVTFTITKKTEIKKKLKKKTHGMITRQDKKKMTPIINLRSRLVVKAFSERKNLSVKDKHTTDTVTRKLLIPRKETTGRGSEDISPPATEQRYKFTAQSFNPETLKSPPRVHVANKAATKPKPFNLTEVKPKEPPPTSPKFKFVAQEVPKRILSTPHGVPEKKKHRTEPKTCKFEHKNRFTFELLDEEKRKRQFMATPIPRFVKLSNTTFASTHSTTCASVSSSTGSKKDQQGYSFKARTAHVLKKKPFCPKLLPRLLQPKNVHLHTELRSIMRKKYNAADKERLKLMEKQKDEIREEEERKERAESKRQAESFKANPIRKYKPVTIKKSSQPLTSPASPHFTKKF